MRRKTLENHLLELIGGISGLIGLLIGWIARNNKKAHVVLLDIAHAAEWCEQVVESAKAAGIPYADQAAYYRSKLEDHLKTAGIEGDAKKAALDKLVKNCIELAKDPLGQNP